MIDFENIDNSIFLKNLYPEGLEIKGDLSEVSFSNNGPSITISFHLKQLPLSKPKKWPLEFNRVHLILEFIEVSQLNFSRWGRENTFDLYFEKDERFKNIKIKGLDIDLNFKSKWISFKSITPYLNE